MIPKLENQNQFVLIDEISLRDETLWDYTKIDLTGDPIGPMNRRLCDPIQMELGESDTRTVLKSFARFGGKDRTQAFLSREASKSSFAHSDSGGSRISYRDAPAWYSPTINANNQITELDIGEFTTTSPAFAGGLGDLFAPTSEVIGTVPLEGESGLENVEFGFWIG